MFNAMKTKLALNVNYVYFQNVRQRMKRENSWSKHLPQQINYGHYTLYN